MGILRQVRGWLVINRGQEVNLSEIDSSKVDEWASDEWEFEDW